MRIAFLSTFYPFRGGISQFNSLIYRELEKEHEVKAYTFTTQYPNFLFPGKSQFVTDQDQVDHIPAKRTLSTLNPISYWLTAQKVLRQKPEILVLRYWMPFFAPALGIVAKLARRKNIVVIAVLDNLIPHERRFGDAALNHFFLNAVDGFIVMSDAVEKDLLTLKPKAKYAFHPHPVYNHFGKKLNQEEVQEKLGIPQGKKVLLFFGLIRAYKGLDVLIKAMNFLDNSYFLLIAGEPYEDFSKYQQLIDESNYSQNIKAHTEYISDNEVNLYFSASDVTVLPYKTATQSGVIAIAYHFELPAITTDVGGLRNTIEPYKAGIIVDQPDSKLLAEKIKIYFGQNMKSKLSENMKQFKEKFSWGSYANQILSLYSSLKTK